MKFWILVVVSFLSTPVLLFSQISDLSPVAKSADNNNRQTRAVLMGKVSIEEASASTEATEVILECGSRARAHTYSDGRGTFSITVSVGGPLPNAIGQPKDGVISHEDWASCELYGDLAGYASERIRLFGDPDTGIVDVGTIVLHPTAQQQQHGFTVSLTSLAAPDKAKKAFEKGQEQVK